MANLKDIAKIAGVNVSTVSRALNNSKGINEETKNRICKIAKEINYIPDQTARALVGKGTKTIGVMLQEGTSYYYTKLLNYLENEVRSNGYSILTGFTNHDFDIERLYFDIFNKRKVDGIILAGSMTEELKNLLDAVSESQNTPMVLIQTFIHFPDYDYIMVDDAYGFDLAIKHLKSLGHYKIGFIADELASFLRLPIFKDTIYSNGLKLDQRFIKIGSERFELGGYLTMKELLKEKERPTAVLASYDNMAVGALKAIYDQGLKVPDDISIIGFDNIRESEFLINPLTTISPPIKEMTELGVNLLLKKIENKEKQVIQHISLKPELIIRNTTSGVL